MVNAHDVLLKPMVSEKSSMMMEKAKYSFFVDKRANKIEIKKAVEEAFKVDVIAVTTRNYSGKPKTVGRYRGRRSNSKRAIVTLKPGQKIEIFSGL